MDLQDVKNYIQQFGELPDDQWLHLAGLMKVISYGPGEFFQKAGEDPKYVGLVLHGIFRVYYSSSEGKEFTRAFAFEKNPIGDYASSLCTVKSKVHIVALEPSLVAVLEFAEYFALFDQHPCWNKIGRRIIERFYVEREQREADLALLSVKERYEKLRTCHPKLFHRVGNALIANYLGMTPETLSRLKAASRK